jgi:hypothetical protein
MARRTAVFDSRVVNTGTAFHPETANPEKRSRLDAMMGSPADGINGDVSAPFCWRGTPGLMAVSTQISGPGVVSFFSGNKIHWLFGSPCPVLLGVSGVNFMTGTAIRPGRVRHAFLYLGEVLTAIQQGDETLTGMASSAGSTGAPEVSLAGAVY